MNKPKGQSIYLKRATISLVTSYPNLTLVWVAFIIFLEALFDLKSSRCSAALKTTDIGEKLGLPDVVV